MLGSTGETIEDKKIMAFTDNMKGIRKLAEDAIRVDLSGGSLQRQRVGSEDEEDTNTIHPSDYS